MSLIQTLVNKVIQLNDRLNQIVLNARKIEDLPPQVEADFNSLIHVSRNGISEKLSLSVLQEAVSEGSVKPRLISVGYLGNPTFAELAQALNARRAINVLAGELPLFHFYDARARGEATVPNPSYRFFTNKKSPNTYGAGGIDIVPSNLIYVSQTNASVDEIESMQGTQIIDLGEIGTANVWDFLNLKDPIISIQNATDGYRLVKTLVDGVSVRYLFLGIGGDYGVGGLQSVAADFAIQSGEIPSSGGGLEPSVIFPDTKINYVDSKSFTIEEGVKVLTFKKNGSTISIDWTQVGNVITYNGLEDLNTEDYFIYNGIKAVSIVEVSGDVPDATTTIKGKLKLAGDLGGTADNPTVPALANIYTKTEVDAKVSSVYVVKEPVATLAALNALTGQVIGWVRNVNDSGMNYVYTASGWDALGSTIDISGKEDKSNKGIANGYAPLGADLKVPSVNVSPLVGGVIFVSASGNNSTAEIENRDKPFLTIDAALTAYWANPKIDYIDIISADTFTATVALNDGATNRKIEIRSQKTCILNINTNGVYSFVSTGGLLVQQQVFNLPFATLNFTPTTGARFGTHSITSPDVRINARNVSFGSLFNNSFSKATLIKIDADSITLNSTINGICDQTAVDIKVKILVFNGANCTLIGVQTGGNLDFEKITHNNTFKLNGDFSPLNINHGSIVGVAPYTNASFSYITVGGINVSYKQGAIITSNVNFNAFNATGKLVLKNEVSYPNSDYLIRGINVSNTIFITDSKITCKKLFGYRCSAKLVINNSYFTITSANFGATEMNNNNNTYESGTVTFEGTNYIIGATDGFNLYLESAEYTQLNKPSIDTTKGILRTNGLIDSAKIDLIDTVLNEY